MSWNSKVEYRHYSSNSRPCTHTCSHISSNISKNTTLLVFRLNTKNFFLNERYQLKSTIFGGNAELCKQSHKIHGTWQFGPT